VCSDSLDISSAAVAPDSECDTNCSKTGSRETCGGTIDRISVYENDYTQVSGFLLVVMFVIKICVLCCSVVDLDLDLDLDLDPRTILWIESRRAWRNSQGWYRAWKETSVWGRMWRDLLVSCRGWQGLSVLRREWKNLLELRLALGARERGDGFCRLRVVVPVEGECVVMKRGHGFREEGFVTEELDQLENDCLLIIRHAFSKASMQ
jgi:hypothetical protein